MLDYALPALFVAFVWWLSTGIVLIIVRRPVATYPVTMAAATAAAVVAIIALSISASNPSPTGAIVAFSAALMLWAWHEISFLTGFLTGSRKTALAHHSGEPDRSRAPFLDAAGTVIHHEIAIALTVAGLYIGLAGSPNPIGLWTFTILWLMRLSAKLNLYLGVRNLAEQFLPGHLSYLKTYFCRRAMNGLFPIVVTAATVATVILAAAAAEPNASPFERTGMTLLATLLGLAVLEHWFLVLPFPADGLWKWGLNDQGKQPWRHPPAAAANARHAKPEPEKSKETGKHQPRSVAGT